MGSAGGSGPAPSQLSIGCCFEEAWPCFVAHRERVVWLLRALLRALLLLLLGGG